MNGIWIAAALVGGGVVLLCWRAHVKRVTAEGKAPMSDGWRNEHVYEKNGDLRRNLMECATAKGISYAWLCGIYRAGLLSGRAMKIGATGTFPYGKLGADDEGELAVAVAADVRNGVVRFEFGKSIAWLALPAAHARQFAALVLDKASELERWLS